MMNRAELKMEELVMVNGGSEGEFVKTVKLMWGWLTGDPEAKVTVRLIKQINEQNNNNYNKGTVVNHSAS